MKSLSRLLSALCACIMLTCVLCSDSGISAEDINSRRVRVGMFEAEGFSTKRQDGSCTGYGVDYLREVARYAGWEYDYVWGTWEECVNMLQNHEIDLLGPMTYFDSRTEIFSYPDIPVGYDYVYVCAKDSDNRFTYNDFAPMNGAKVGMLQGDIQNNMFEELCRERGAEIIPVYYTNSTAVFKDLQAGRIDLGLTRSYQVACSEKMVGQYLPAGYYFCTWKGNDIILAEFNDAVNQIRSIEPQFEANLREEYSPKDLNPVLVLSKDELAYVEEHPILRVAYLDNMAPLEYYDAERNCFSGITAEVFHRISVSTGISFDYIPVKSSAEALRLIIEGKADLIAGVMDTSEFENQELVTLTAEYMKIPCVMVKRSNVFSDPERKFSIALPEGRGDDTVYLKETYPNARFRFFSTSEECIQEVNKKHSDATFLQSYVAEEILKNPSFNQVNVTTIPEISYGMHIGIKNPEDKTLVVLLNKAIGNISKSDMTGIIMRHTQEIEVPTSVKALIYQNPFYVILAMFVLFAVIFAILLHIFRLRRNHAKEMERLAYYDSVVPCWNSNRFTKEAAEILNRHPERIYAACIFDIKKFKYINESYGHPAGDRVLCYVAKTIRPMLQEGMIFARKNADKFCLMFSAANEKIAMDTLATIFMKLEVCVLENAVLRLSYDCGIFLMGKDDRDIDVALDKAEYARNYLKTNGGSSSFCFFNNKMERTLQKEKDIEEKMHAALERGEFKVFFQPKFDMMQNRIVGAEALVRWNSRDKGFLRPDEFIPVMEKNGFIVQVDFYVLEEVCKLMNSWIRAGKTPIPISVNQSRRHFNAPNYIAELEMLIGKYGIPKNVIELELTENSFQENRSVVSVMERMKSLGFMLSMDDFGSGFSSLNLLREIPIDVLKLDKGFLSETGNANRNSIVVRHIVEMAKNLEISVICEGVETSAQAEFIHNAGCDVIQGYYFYKPMPMPEFLKVVEPYQ